MCDVTTRKHRGGLKGVRSAARMTEVLQISAVFAGLL